MNVLASDFSAVSPGVSTNPSGIPKSALMPLIAAFQKAEGDKPAANINLALFIAAGALLNKRTWDQKDYALHWLHVAEVNNRYVSMDEKIVGILHDVVEDSDWTIEDLERVGFPPKICEAVRRLTKQEGMKYLDGGMYCSVNQIARRVKIRDNHHNMDITRSNAEMTPKQKYLYKANYKYLDAVEEGVIDPGYSFWKFLQMPVANGLLNADSYSYIAAELSEPAPQAVIDIFGQPKAVLTKKPKAGQETALVP